MLFKQAELSTSVAWKFLPSAKDLLQVWNTWTERYHKHKQDYKALRYDTHLKFLNLRVPASSWSLFRNELTLTDLLHEYFAKIGLHVSSPPDASRHYSKSNSGHYIWDIRSTARQSRVNRYRLVFLVLLEHVWKTLASQVPVFRLLITVSLILGLSFKVSKQVGEKGHFAGKGSNTKSASAARLYYPQVQTSKLISDDGNALQIPTWHLLELVPEKGWTFMFWSIWRLQGVCVVP